MIWCFDPGAVATGVGWLGPGKSGAKQFKDPIEAYAAVMIEAELGDHFLVEDFSHGGAFTKEAKETLKVLGFLELRLRMEAYTVVLRHKDKRLSGQGRAAELMGSDVKTLKTDPLRKDAFAALAHCVVYERDVFHG